MRMVNLSAGSLVMVVAASQNFILFPRKLEMFPYVHSQAHLRPVPNVMNFTNFTWCPAIFHTDFMHYLPICFCGFFSFWFFFFTKLLYLLHLRLYFTVDGISL